MRKKTLIILLVAAVVLLAAGCVLWNWCNEPAIPRLYFEGNISDMYKKSDVRQIQVAYSDGEYSFQGYAHLKVQGTSSLAYDKKNYTIKFYKDINGNEKMPVDVGWGAQNTYCLKANWVDRNHARNIVTARLASQMQQKYDLLTQTPCNGLVDGFPIEIYSNGKFLGLYTFNIPKSDWQFSMDSDNPNHIVLCGENWEPACYFRAEPDFQTWSVEVGEENEATLNKARALFDFIMNSTDEEFVENFEDHLNLDSVLNYYVMSDLAYMGDNRGKNMLLVTYDGVKWYLSLYDLDTAWGTRWDGKGLFDYAEEPLKLNESLLFERMERCFPEELAQRYFELRQDILSNEHIMEEFEAFRATIPPMSFIKETWKWSYGFIRIRSDIPGYEYDQIEEYLNTIPGILDSKYTAMLGCN